MLYLEGNKEKEYSSFDYRANEALRCTIEARLLDRSRLGCNKDVEDNIIVIGNPARLIKWL